jgi:hypothetical protein
MDQPPSAEAGASGLDAPVGGRRRRHHPHMPISRIANLTPGNWSVKQCGDEDDDHSDIVMPTPRRQSPRPTTPFTDGRHHAEVGIIVYAKTCCGW